MKTLFRKLSIMACLLSPCVQAFASFKVGNLDYSVSSESTCYVSDCSESATSVIIPQKITYGGKTYSVTSIGENAFEYCESLTSVNIPSSVTSIGSYAFKYCSSLTSVNIPGSVTSIGSYAFKYCSSLTSVNIPSSVTSIGGEAFVSCKSLTKVIVEDITAWCCIKFENEYSNPLRYAHCLYSDKNTEIKDLKIPDSVTSIGDYAFCGCTSLVSATIPNSVTSIGDYAFLYCTSLASVTIPNSVTSIGSGAFCDCSSLTSVTIPNSVTSIGSGAFCYCSGLTSVTIPNSVTSIGDNAFRGCTSLVSATIPNSVTSIGNRAFSNCTSLASVTIPNSVTSIGTEAFFGCSSLASVTIPNSVTSIGNRAFSGLKRIIWLTSTPPKGYENVYSKVNYVSNNSYSKLNNTMVYPYLGSMFEVDGITYVPTNPSERTCDAIYCTESSTVTYIKIDNAVEYKGVKMTMKGITPYFCYDNKCVKNIEISCAGSIGEHAFDGCSGIQQLVIPNTITGMGTDCFSNCTSLKSIDLGSGINEIGDSVLYNCSSLVSITIPKNVESIGCRVFEGCKSLSEVIIADRDTKLAFGASTSPSPSLFNDCPIKKAYIGGNITYSVSPFKGNTSLETVIITDKDTEIYREEFYGCTNLKHISMGDNIEKIGDNAFSGCSSLEELTFGAKLKSIGSGALSSCAALTKLTVKAEVPPTCGTQALDDINKWTCTLCVPAAQLDAYKAADQWKDFFFFETIETGVESTSADDVTEVERFSIDGTRLTSPAKGINIVKYSDGSVRKVLVK